MELRSQEVLGGPRSPRRPLGTTKEVLVSRARISIGFPRISYYSTRISRIVLGFLPGFPRI